MILFVESDQFRLNTKALRAQRNTEKSDMEKVKNNPFVRFRAIRLN